ncbi:hypothetical protein ES707_15773 [subsurface metagenome]
MLHITRISSIVPRSEKSEDCFMTVIFSNDDIIKMVLPSSARADLVKHLQAIPDLPLIIPKKKKPSTQKKKSSAKKPSTQD